MMKNNELERLREELLFEVDGLHEKKAMSKQFIYRFFRIIELCTFSMLNGSEDFFAYFFIQMKRKIDIYLSVPCQSTISYSGFIMHFNPIIFLKHNEHEMQALIKHEIYHIISGHHRRSKAISHKYSRLAINLAMDISINEYIINLPSWMPKLLNISKSFDVYLNEKSTMEQYAEAIQCAINKLRKDKNGGSLNASDEDLNGYIELYKEEKAHELWEKDEEIDAVSIKEMTKKYVLTANKGKLPNSIEEFLRELKDDAELSWKDYLRRLLGVMPAGFKKTSTRKDRRQPDRLDLRGRLRKHIAQITIAIDISGSISDIEIEQIMKEVLAIVKNYSHELTIIECDNQVRRAYKLRNTKDLRKKLNTRGATRFTPVFKFMMENNMKNDILIFFTDGLGEEKLELIPVNKKTIWVLTGKGEELSLENPFGVVKRLSERKIERPEYAYAPDAIKEYRMLEWSSF